MDATGAVLLSAFVGAVVAVVGIATQRNIARRRATFEHIAAVNRDGDVIAARRKFIELAKNDGGLGIWASEENEKTEETQSIRLVLNEFELVAIGIWRGIIDEKFYRLWFEASVIQFWKHADPFVSTLRNRTENPALYKEFQAMAVWFDNGERPHKRRLLRKFF